MNQKTAVEKIYIEMTDRNLCSPVIEHEIKFYLDMIYGAGFDKGRTNRGRQMRAVIKLSKTGDRLKKYASTGEASRHTGIDRSSIASVARGDRDDLNSAGGYYWMYEE